MSIKAAHGTRALCHPRQGRVARQQPQDSYSTLHGARSLSRSGQSPFDTQTQFTTTVTIKSISIPKRFCPLSEGQKLCRTAHKSAASLIDLRLGREPPKTDPHGAVH